MKKNDVVIITLNGQRAKKYFLDKITENSGIVFKKIPEEPIIIEERRGKKKTEGILFDLRELKLLDEAKIEQISNE